VADVTASQVSDPASNQAVIGSGATGVDRPGAGSRRWVDQAKVRRSCDRVRPAQSGKHRARRCTAAAAIVVLFVNAEWREAAPSELEEALIEPIEEAMRGLPGLTEMRSESNRGRGGVQLSFGVGTDMTRVMLDVVARLNTLPPLPPDADEPQVFGGDNFQTQNAASLLVRPVAGRARCW